MLYFSSHAARSRNLALAATNSLLTLVILLIAPLGLAAVIINTLLVGLATYATGTIADRLVGRLHAGGPSPNVFPEDGGPPSYRRGPLDRP